MRAFPCRLGTPLTVSNSQPYVILECGSRSLSSTCVCVDVKIDPPVLTCRGLGLCKEFGPHLCPPHRLGPHLARRSAGQPLFLFTTGTFTTTLRRFLSLSLFEDSQKFTLKAFRAGRATEIAAQGNALGTILLGGEWSGSAVLRYVTVDAIEEQSFL